jgi:hypothetical protein
MNDSRLPDFGGIKLSVDRKFATSTSIEGTRNTLGDIPEKDNQELVCLSANHWEQNGSSNASTPRGTASFLSRLPPVEPWKPTGVLLFSFCTRSLYLTRTKMARRTETVNPSAGRRAFLFGLPSRRAG